MLVFLQSVTVLVVLFRKMRSRARSWPCAVQPVLLLWGADDPWIRPQSAERIRSLYPRAEKVLLPGVGHCPQVSAASSCRLKWLCNVLLGLQEAQIDAMIPTITDRTCM